MPSTRKRDAKDAARKTTLNPPASKQKVRAHEREVMERKDERPVGQYSGAGTPALQKK